MNSEIKVLFISSWYPCRVTPTNGNFIQRHAETVARYCNTASLFVISDSNVKSGYEITEETINGVYTVIVYYPKTKNTLFSFLKKYFNYKKAILFGYKKIEAQFGKPDVLHGNIILPAGLMVRRLSEKLNIPYILTEHWTGFLKNRQDQLPWIQKQLAKYAIAKATFICPVSFNLKQCMQKLGLQGNYKVIANVVDESLFVPPKEKKQNEKTHFLHVSNLNDEHKNVSGIIRAIQSLSKITTHFHFTIMGDGNPAPYQKIADDMHIHPSLLHIEGEKTLQEIAYSMQKADVFVLFSHYENLPCVISEAHMVGIPVIATNVGGIPEMINEENGILVEPGNETQLTEALLSFTRINKKNSSEIIRFNALKKYGIQQIGKEYFMIYQKCKQ
ncbi:MAG: glycosyltransferase [Flavobacteriales bacterium]|nr:glycosyltransferase [Flavobacteriales bacterium]